ncbi:sugar phosphate nucleotidyltransferase [Micromonospora humi]|uniref:Nucleotidyl transferase n=1 Tax=Micromonospora humi TaxID=745366 RepID=A0A1C5K7C0_9ACTN|nr:sugar phosphate nucleotidyltransferase [Micromonospora humi]SCG78688.1 Nucleotidyl transferase [Micromonospora humi]
MHVVIMAGGKGVRLRPYTSVLPKPLVPIGDNYAILEIVLLQLAARGFRRVTLAINHLGSLIRAFVGDGSRFGLEVDYLEERTPLSTIGPLFSMRARLPEHFLVMNGDVLTDLDYADLLDTHVRAGAPLTVATYQRSVKIDFGVLEAQGGKVTSFTEKPVLHYRVSMGVYGVSARAVADYPVGQPFGFDELVLDLLRKGEPPASYDFDGYWLDIGRPEDYDEANRRFHEIESRLLPAETAVRS